MAASLDVPRHGLGRVGGLVGGAFRQPDLLADPVVAVGLELVESSSPPDMTTRPPSRTCTNCGLT